MDAFDLAQLAKEKSPYVTFKTEPKEDIPASKAEGRYIAKDIEYACITTPGSKDIHVEQLPQWWDKVKEQVQNGRCPQSWASKWREQYEHWKKGLEIPTEGTPIRGWAVISPAQQEMIIRSNIYTVEDLATANGDTLQNIGMGSVALKYKAEGWLKEAGKRGKGAQEMAAVKRENDHLRSEVETLKKQVEQLVKSSKAEKVSA